MYIYIYYIYKQSVLLNHSLFKYHTLFWQRLRIILYLYFFSVKYFQNTQL